MAQSQPEKKKKKTDPKLDEGGSSSSVEAPLSMERKVFNDPIHGHMEFDRCLVKIIDTPQFQRLRNIKQLGGGYFVYPGASHNRFEHSLGVAHLAGELVRSLQKNQEELGIDERDVRCVEIAGLCHDLGHGPFSHMFDMMFIPKVSKARPELEKWEHEKASVQLFDYIVEKLNERGFDLETELKELSEENEDNKSNDDLVFIKEMIKGLKKEEQPKGRGENKRFLYEIVANKRNGIDVDKFDYFARDCHHLGLKSSFDHRRYIKFARVCEVDGQLQICTRDKELPNLYEMFHTRSRLHQKAYQHKTKRIIELMITEAFLKAEPILNISRVIDKNGDIDPEEYTKLTDDIFEKILHSPKPELKEARDILEKVVSREIYRHVGKTKEPKTQTLTQEKEKKEDKIKRWKSELANKEVTLTEDDFEVDITTISFGMKDKNPMEELHFYKKSDIINAFMIRSDQVSEFLPPRNFSEDWINVYYRGPDKNMKVAYKHFCQWCRDNNFPLPPPEGDSSDDSSVRPPDTSSA